MLIEACPHTARIPSLPLRCCCDALASGMTTKTALRAFNNIEERRKQSSRATQRKWSGRWTIFLLSGQQCLQTGCRTCSATKASNSEIQACGKFCDSFKENHPNPFCRKHCLLHCFHTSKRNAKRFLSRSANSPANCHKTCRISLRLS